MWSKSFKTKKSLKFLSTSFPLLLSLITRGVVDADHIAGVRGHHVFPVRRKERLGLRQRQRLFGPGMDDFHAFFELATHDAHVRQAVAVLRVQVRLWPNKKEKKAQGVKEIPTRAHVSTPARLERDGKYICCVYFQKSTNQQKRHATPPEETLARLWHVATSRIEQVWLREEGRESSCSVHVRTCSLNTKPLNSECVGSTRGPPDSVPSPPLRLPLPRLPLNVLAWLPA